MAVNEISIQHLGKDFIGIYYDSFLSFEVRHNNIPIAVCSMVEDDNCLVGVVNFYDINFDLLADQPMLHLSVLKNQVISEIFNMGLDAIMAHPHFN